MIRIDRSSRSLVAVCVCGARDVFTHAAALDAWARNHIVVAHPPADLDGVQRAQRDAAITAARGRRHRAT